MKRILNQLFEWLQSRCNHQGFVVADILEGEGDKFQVEWCYRCGAYRRYWPKQTLYQEWRKPKACWAEYQKQLDTILSK